MSLLTAYYLDLPCVSLCTCMLDVFAKMATPRSSAFLSFVAWQSGSHVPGGTV